MPMASAQGGQQEEIQSEEQRLNSGTSGAYFTPKSEEQRLTLLINWWTGTKPPAPCCTEMDEDEAIPLLPLGL